MGSSSTNQGDAPGGAGALAAGFAQPSEAEWLGLVEQVLKGAPIAKLDSATAGGVVIHPLYTRHNSLPIDATPPGLQPFTRGSTAVAGDGDGDNRRGWATRVEVGADGDGPALTAERSVEALERGATELALVTSEISGVDELDAALAGVMLDLAPVHLRPGERFGEVARWLTALWDRRGVGATEAVGGLGADPVAVLASTGTLDGGIDGSLAELGELAASTADSYPGVRAVSISSTPFADAGADEVTELAIVLSTGAAYLRACASAGMTANAACGQIELTLTTDSDVFTGVAKLRAARRLWSTLARACGASDAAAAPRIVVRTSAAMMTRRDPWVNLLRVTAASLAAALGGADALVTLPYDQRLGEHGELGRRMARNTQLLLAEESNLSRVVDPMGGSWYLESLTDELALAAWARFQELEAAGGMPTVLLDGSLNAGIASSVGTRMARIATRREAITGVSEFPNLAEDPPLGPEPERADHQGTDRHGPDRGPSAAPSASGATVVEPLQPVHWAADFEALRDRSDSYLANTGSRPRVFLVNLGPVAKHTARATYAQNFYAAGGIEAATSGTGSTTGFTDPAAAVDDARRAAADAICICSSDDIYAESAVPVASALATAGLGPIHLAGRPGDLEGPLRAAGVTEFIHMGVDAIEILTRAHDNIRGTTAGTQATAGAQATAGTQEVDR